MAVRYTRGLHPVRDGVWAYLQPDGGWGWSNAGLITDGEAALLVDTLFDERLTAEMLETMRAVAGRPAERIDVLVNTHANGDHTFGNHLVKGARIVASEASANEMETLPPQELDALMRRAGSMGEAGAFLQEIFGAFDFSGIPLTRPDETFTGRLSLKVGDKPVELVEVGPAHTEGDILVHLPEQRLLFSGDMLFIDGTPILWSGPVENWIRACDWMCAQDLEMIVPGHGPITDAVGVRAVRDYWVYLDREARARHAAGMPPESAASDIDLGVFGDWGDPERIVINVFTLYRGYGDPRGRASIPDLFGMMARLRRERGSAWRGARFSGDVRQRS